MDHLGGYQVAVADLKFELERRDEVAPFTVFSKLLSNGIEFVLSEREYGSAVDFGSGSGVQAILLARLGVERVFAIERDEVAAFTILRNAQENGVEAAMFPSVPAKGISVVVSSSLASLGNHRVDLIVSNPPTMPECGGMPLWANGGNDGRDALRDLITEGGGRLSVNGELLIVHSSLAGLRLTTRLFNNRGFLVERLIEVLTKFRPWYSRCSSIFNHLSSIYDVEWAESPGGDLYELISVIKVYKASGTNG